MKHILDLEALLKKKKVRKESMMLEGPEEVDPGGKKRRDRGEGKCNQKTFVLFSKNR